MRSFSVVSGENALAQQYNNLRYDARGAGNLLAHQQIGAIALPTNPSNAQTLTLTINGTAIPITFVAAIGSTAGNVLIGGTAALTLANLLALLNQPQTTTTTGVALTAANQALVSYLSWALSGTTVTPSSNNTSLYAPLSSFSASTTATGGSYTASTMKLFVEAGVVYVNGTRVIYAGGSTPAVTAPAANPRIDVLTIDSSGTLAWTTGAENASPVAPTYPANKVAVCELYNVVGETSLYDNSNQQTNQGYVLNDVRPFLTYPFAPGALAVDLIPDATDSRNLGSASFEWNDAYAKKFHGDGSLLTNITTPLIGITGTAAEVIAANAAVAAGWYQSDGGVQSDFATLSANFGGVAGSHTETVTIGANSNRYIVVVLMRNGTTTDPTGITINGVAMTNLFANTLNTNLGYSFWVLSAPASGSQSVVFNGISNTAGVYKSWISSYYGVSQSGQPNASNRATNSGITTLSNTLTPTVDGAVVVTLLATGVAITGQSEGAFNQTGSTGPSVSDFRMSDSGVIVPKSLGSAATVTTGSATGIDIVQIALAPATAPTYAYVNANSANPALSGYYSSQKNRSLAFAGFAAGSAVAGGAITVNTAGLMSGFSSLVALQQYYLNDTNGTIGVTAGTNTRKVGIAIDATHLIITNTW
jgi:hypothetical protein